MKPDPENEIEFYVDDNFTGRWNQDEGMDPRSVLSRTVYTITYANFPIIWAIHMQTEIAIITTEAEYIELYSAMRDVLPFFSLMTDIEYVTKLQCETEKLLCSLF